MRIDEDTYYTVRNNMIILANPRHRSDNPVVREESLINLTECKPHGYLSYKAQKKMRNLLELWYNSVYHENIECIKNNRKNEHYMAFLTLTLSGHQDHTEHNDLFIKRYMLEPYIQELQLLYKVKNYVWKAERQSQTNNTHFHLIIDKFIEYKNLRDLWNKYQKKHGYIEKYQKKRYKNYSNELKVLKYLLPDKIISKQLYRLTAIQKSIFQNKNLTENKKKHLTNFIEYLRKRRKKTYPSSMLTRILNDKKDNFENPNSTDIKNIKKVKSIIGYMAKEMSKTSPYERQHQKTVAKIRELAEKIVTAINFIKNEWDDNTKKQIQEKKDDLQKYESLKKSLLEKKTELEKKLINGRVHGQSDDLKSLHNYCTALDDSTTRLLHNITKTKKFIKLIQEDFFEIYIFPVWQTFKKYATTLYHTLHEHYTSLYNDLYKSKDDILTIQEIYECHNITL